MMDISAWLEGRPVRDDSPVVAITAFSTCATGEYRRAALMLSAIPRRIFVTDEQACDLPADLARWRPIALSCIEHDGRPVPVVNLAHAFSGALSDLPTVPSLAEAYTMETDATVLTP